MFNGYEVKTYGDAKADGFGIRANHRVDADYLPVLIHKRSS